LRHNVRSSTLCTLVALFAGDQGKSSNKGDVDSDSDLLPPAGVVVKRTAKSVCTRSAVTRSKAGRKK